MNVTSPFGNSDHCQVEFATYFEHTIASQSDNACRKVYDWDTADFNGMSGTVWSGTVLEFNVPLDTV